MKELRSSIRVIRTPPILEFEPVLCVDDVHVESAALHDMDKLVGIAHLEQVLPGRDVDALDGLAQVKEDGLVEVAEHVKAEVQKRK